MNLNIIEAESSQKGRVLRASRKKLLNDTEKKPEQPEELAMLNCLKRIAAIPTIEGLAFSRTKLSGSLYFTVIEKGPFSEDGNAAHALHETTSAIYALGDALGEIMPGSFMRLGERSNFSSAVRFLRRKRHNTEKDILAIIHFTK
ncbi:MAG: hypothetical protein NUV73_01615 [Candidatus Daviesbacteria bacterium]|nr:hypothetical protein [Candidatus Daviesbacteria bacterium]